MTRPMVLLCALSLLAACEAADPYRRTDVWYPTGANAGNIAAMAANPRDMIVGRGSSRSDSRQDADAVERVLQDKEKPLLRAASGAGFAPGGAAAGGRN